MSRLKAFFSASLILATLPALGQTYGQYPAQERHRSRNHAGYSQFDSGLRDGGRGGRYYDPRHANDGYDERYRQNDGYYRRDSGIGPGKGALIGGAGGAILGALFGGGLKGTIIGGAAGAGIGAAVGKARQNHRRNNENYPQDNNYYPR